MSITLNPELIQKDQELFKIYQEKYFNVFKRKLQYGTAGFREKHIYLEHVCLRVGIFQGLSSKLNPNKVLGIQITASHNPIQDNGIKQSDFDGAMLRKSLEDLVDEFVNTPDLASAFAQLNTTLALKFPEYNSANKGMVFIGCDTRPSSKKLVELIDQGVQAVGCETKIFGEVTTPMLHFFVKHFNLDEHNYTKSTPAAVISRSYQDHFIGHFSKFFKLLPGYSKRDNEKVLLDCANGIGGPYAKEFSVAINPILNLEPINIGDLNFLNDCCGAEYVHKEHKFPREVVERLKQYSDLSSVRCLAFDGDADRIVYFLPKPTLDELILFDGDRMICLFGVFFKKILGELDNLTKEINKSGVLYICEDFSRWKIGMVQTAYANGSSTKYMREVQKLECVFSANGVKNLHPMAHHYDVGIYCESNGHGTFTVKDDKVNILKLLLQLGQVSATLAQQNSLIHEYLVKLELLYHFIQTQNMVVGDAITDFLCIESALAYLKLGIRDWLNFYNDKVCLNSKVQVKYRLKIKLVQTEDVITEPKNLQDEINNILSNNPGSRAFARPSGTEDYVRIYVEADNIEVVKKVSDLVGKALLNNKEIN